MSQVERIFSALVDAPSTGDELSIVTGILYGNVLTALARLQRDKRVVPLKTKMRSTPFKRALNVYAVAGHPDAAPPRDAASREARAKLPGGGRARRVRGSEGTGVIAGPCISRQFKWPLGIGGAF